MFTINGEDYGAVSGYRALTAENAEIFAYVSKDARSEKQPLAIVFPYGKGKAAAVGADFGRQYSEHRQYLHKSVINTVLNALYTPAVKLSACEGTLEITDLYKDGTEYIQLVNANGCHADPTSASEDRILPCRDITLSVEAPEKPEKLILRPAGTELPFTWKNGRAEVSIDRVDIHEIIEVAR